MASNSSLIKTLENLLKAQQGGGGFLRGGSSGANVAADITNVRNQLTAAGPEGQLALKMHDIQESQKKQDATWNQLKVAGNAAIGDGGPLSSKGSTFQGTTNTIGEGFKTVGGNVPGVAGDGLKIVGALTQIAGKLDKWGGEQLQSTFNRFKDTNIGMNWMADSNSRRSAGNENYLAQKLLPHTQALANARNERDKAFQPYDEMIEKVKMTTGTWLAKAGTTVANAGSQAWAAVDSTLFGGKTWEERQKEKNDVQEAMTNIDLMEWAADENWLSAYGRPDDL